MSKGVVSPHLYHDYDYFAEQADPFNLSGEIAALRTLLVEVRENMTEDATDKLIDFGQVVEGLVLAYLMEIGWDNDEASEHADEIARRVVKAYTSVFGIRPRLSSKEALDVAKTMEIISKVSERYKKICDGIVLRVEYDKRFSDLLQKFVMTVVMPFMPVKDRKPLAMRCYEFLPNLREMEPLALAGAVADGDVLESESLELDEDE